MIRTVVIPAAGYGKRFLPMTRALPKEMLPLVDKPIIQYVVEEAVASGLDRILIVVGRGKEAIINHFDRQQHDDSEQNDVIGRLPDIYFVRQKEPKGLADAIRCARDFVGDESFVIKLGDTEYTSNSGMPVTAQLIRRHEKIGSSVVAIEKVPREKIKDYGIISGRKIDDGLWSIDDLVEKPGPENAPSDMGITGTYILTPGIFDCIDGISPGKNGELQLTDALRLMLRKEKIFGSEFDGTRYDIGTIPLWIQINHEFIKRDPRYSHLV